MARPKKDISGEHVAKLAQLGASVQEIADFFSVDPSTIHRRFAREIDKGRTSLKLRLRRLQLRAAERGNVGMLIWLGKTVLRQTENAPPEVAKIEVIIEADDDDDNGSGRERMGPGELEE